TSSVKALPTTTSAVKEIPNTTSSKAIPTSGATEGGSYKPSKENVKIIGRGIFNDDYLWFGLTDSGIEYKFTGKSTSISVSAEVNSGNPVRYYVYTDGKLYADSLLEKTSSEVTIEFDEVAEHVVTFIKVSECANGTVRITGISADGKIEPTDVAEKKIEFIGDSITCAYGVDGKDTDTFSTKNENGVKSYAYKVAKKFNADYSMVSYSGFGIISGYSTDGKRNEDAALPQYYDKLGFSYWNQFDGDIKQMKEVQWNFEDFVPDLIVINLGTNDNSYMNNISADKKKSELAAFVTEYQEFITKIRSANPDADILCTLGIMGQELYPQIEEAVSNYKKETGDEKVNAFKFNVQNLSKNGKAVDWHPAHQSHVDAAYELIEEIESLYGW
ncbi:carbohydrate esterase family 2 protein, partial [Piromyces sp. E2]